MTVNPYLMFKDNAADALEFYAELFGGQIEAVMRVKDSPMANKMPDEMQDRVMHGLVRIGDNCIMVSDEMQPGSYQPPSGITLQTAFDDLDKAKRVFARLSKGGAVTMPFEPTFWAAGFGMCTDRFGVPWMVNCEEGLQEGAQFGT